MLEGATVKQLTTAGYDPTTGMLTLTFGDDLTAIEVGKPYIVKWEAGDDITDPLFRDVTLAAAQQAAPNDYVSFRGNYSPMAVQDASNLLYLGDDSRFFYPAGEMTVNAFRGYLDFNDAYLVGDMNGDAKVDVADVSILINTILGKSLLGLSQGDMNGDGTLDVADVSILIDIVLNKTSFISGLESNVDLGYGGTATSAAR